MARARPLRDRVEDIKQAIVCPRCAGSGREPDTADPLIDDRVAEAAKVDPKVAVLSVELDRRIADALVLAELDDDLPVDPHDDVDTGSGVCRRCRGSGVDPEAGEAPIQSSVASLLMVDPGLAGRSQELHTRVAEALDVVEFDGLHVLAPPPRGRE